MSCQSCGAAGPFSKAQKRRGVSNRRCVDCVSGGCDGFECATCGRTFRDQNALTQHSVTHRERNFACPGCGKLSRGITDTASHFESGACPGCLGQDNARKAAYQLVARQHGGSNFLTAPRQLLTNGEDAGGSGYRAEGPNYQCPACSHSFTRLSSLMQHQQNRPQCAALGRQLSLPLGPPSSAEQTLRFFHGTTWKSAVRIERNGFMESEDGHLGRGVYVARQDKAERFVLSKCEQTGEYHGGLVEVLVTFRNAKYVVSNDYHWQQQGYDACRAETTLRSTNMEWCIKSASQIEVIRIHYREV